MLNPDSEHSEQWRRAMLLRLYAIVDEIYEPEGF